MKNAPVAPSVTSIEPSCTCRPETVVTAPPGSDSSPAASSRIFEELSAKGVALQEPAERPYGIEALFRDDSGNWFSLTQAKWLG